MRTFYSDDPPALFKLVNPAQAGFSGLHSQQTIEDSKMATPVPRAYCTPI
jgi:hypothetical protein